MPKYGTLTEFRFRLMSDDQSEIDVEQGTISFTPRRQFHFGAPYLVPFHSRFEAVVPSLTTRDFRVLFALLRSCGIGNTINISRTALEHQTGISVNHISTILRKLERLEIISIIERGRSYMLNEMFFWRGSAEARQDRGN